MTKTQIDFLGIGAQRAGTSWLWENLRQHPDIWMPPRKELHYFDRSLNYPSPNLLATSHVISRLFGTADHHKKFRHALKKELWMTLRRRNWKHLRWILHFYLGTYNDEWYASLFRYGGDKIKGEITPAYSILELEDVQHICSLFPRVKAILLLRNPVERAWSHIRFAWTRGKLDNLENLDGIMEFIDSPSQSLRSDYVRTLKIWLACLPKERMFIGFYDDIVQNPEGLFSAILRFLGAKAVEMDKFPDLHRRVNISREREMPREVKYHLARKYRDQIEALTHMVGSHSLAWLKETDDILKSLNSK